MPARHSGRRFGRPFAIVTAAALLVALLPANALAAPERPDFTVQPGGAVAGQPFATQPVVSIVKGNSVVTSATGSITLSIASNPSGGVLTCTGGPSRTLAAGVASFSGCSINNAGNGYTLLATWDQGGSATSSPFTVAATGGTATKLAFTTQPGGGAVGVAWAVQPIIAVQDASGNTVTTSTASVTLAIGTNPGGGTLTCSGGLTKSAVAGVAAFSGCKIDKAGVGYTLTATSSGLTGATSALFTISSLTAVKLAFVTQPARGTPAGAFAGQPVVAVQDVNGVTDTTSTASITLAIGTNPGGGSLTCSGGLTKNAVSGIAAFGGCKISAFGVGYTLVASAAALTPATSAQFDVADRLVFTTQPSGATGGTAFTTQPVVAVRAGPTNAATHDQVTQVTLGITSGSGAAGAILTCTSGLTRTVVNGLAAFGGCAISTGGTGYTIVASSPGLTSATSAPFNVTGVTLLVVSPSASVINYPSSVTLFVHIASLGIARIVDLQTSRDLVNWSALTALSTNASGDATFTYAPRTNLYYRASFAGAPGLGAGTSLATRVIVRQSAALKPNAGTIRLVNRGTRITYIATVRPLPLAGSARVTFLIYKRVNGVWAFRTSATLPANGAGVATFAWTWGRGEWYIRARANTTVYNAARLSTIARIIAR
jgi:hypothetical protein